MAKSAFDINSIMELAIGLIVVAALIPVALNMFSSANIDFTGSMAGLENLWILIPMMVILGIAIAVIYYAMGTMRKGGKD